MYSPSLSAVFRVKLFTPNNGSSFFLFPVFRVTHKVLPARLDQGGALIPQLLLSSINLSFSSFLAFFSILIPSFSLLAADHRRSQPLKSDFPPSLFSLFLCSLAVFIHESPNPNSSNPNFFPSFLTFHQEPPSPPPLKLPLINFLSLRSPSNPSFEESLSRPPLTGQQVA